MCDMDRENLVRPENEERDLDDLIFGNDPGWLASDR